MSGETKMHKFITEKLMRSLEKAAVGGERVRKREDPWTVPVLRLIGIVLGCCGLASLKLA